ncbi:MAG: DUF4832 domain-containing protein [Phycisphaerae bacterium]
MAEVIRKVRPTPTDDYLGNPHKGCCTFQHFNGDPLFAGERWSEEGPLEFPNLARSPQAGDMPASVRVTEGYLPTTVAYCRWFWSVLEPKEGQYDFSMIDKSLATCAQRGQTLAVRLMAFGSRTQPPVPAWYSARYPMEKPTVGHGESLHPVHNSDEYLAKWGGLILEAGRRYDKHPLIESIDVAFIGPWGEGAGTCSVSRCREFAALWKEAWPTTPRLALIGGDQMREGVATGSGWRCDCFGDLSAKGSEDVPKHLSFNHHFDAYPSQVYKSGAKDAWQRGPVHFETCGVPMSWYRLGFNLDFIIQQGLKFHGTYFMPKSTRLPEAWMGRLAEFCRNLGYRFVLRYAIFDLHVPRGGQFRFQAWVENMGVAPIYRRYQFAVRLRQGQRTAVIPLEDEDIRTWLPGDTWLDKRLTLPNEFERGYVEVSAGIIDPATKHAKVSFAVKERYADRWTPLDGFHVE